MTAESPQSGESAPAPGPSAVAQAISGCGADNDANFGADQFRRDQGKPAVVETDPKVRGWDWTLFAWFFASSVLGFAAIVGAYLVIGTQFESRGRFITAADRITASFAVATALGALAALVVSIRKQTLAERVAQGHVAAAFTERFRSAAQQLGAAAAAERMAGVYAMAALADEYPSRRQQCVDVLCGYLRLPFDPDTDHFAEHSTTRTTTDSGVTQTEHWAPASQPFDLQVRATILYLIRMHTHRERDDQTPSWSHLNFDFQGVHFVDADFSYCQFSGATTLFNGARFTGKAAAFTAAMFDGASASFEKAEFICSARFGFTQFRGGEGNFEDAIFHDESVFTHARFELEDVEVRWGWGGFSFKGAQFKGARTTFGSATMNGDVYFDDAVFEGEKVDFSRLRHRGGYLSFVGATFDRVEISFNLAALHGTDLWFAGGGEQAVFRGSQLTFDGASFAEFLNVQGLEDPHVQEGASITRSGKPFRVKPINRKVITTEVQFHKCDVCGS